ncbi:MAG TPA: UDP-glucose/GDP-mannose dehydrogenase family protein [Patescibacteria group bacterium]|nr:UDP-glucose/GDP-mannose dehydrogenase family protein [Patescibacteria group bacterium]
MKITFVGHGYVGLVSAAIFADLGNTVSVIGHTPETVEKLNQGKVHIYEPGLDEIVKRNIDAGRLKFSLDYDSVPEAEIIFTAVGTPPKESGEADLSTVLEVAKKIGENLSGYTVVVTKSTVPIGINKKIKEVIEKVKPEKAEFDMGSCPEFLRQGSAISDTLNPDRIVIGTESKRAEEILIELHRPLQQNTNAPYVLTNLETAEMIKYAANAFLSTKISFANSIAQLSEKCGADALAALAGIGFDHRIGKDFLAPGPGYGGSCFPKDVKALISIAHGYDYDFKLLKEVENVNNEAKQAIVRKAEKLLGEVKDKSIGVLGLAFKPNTDDMRFAPSIEIIGALVKKGASVKAYDPESMEKAKKVIDGINYKNTADEVVNGIDLLIVLTEWNEFRELDMKKVKSEMKSPKIIDARNIYNPTFMREIGFEYIGVGR